MANRLFNLLVNKIILVSFLLKDERPEIEMKNRREVKEFYDELAAKYREENIVYHTLSGILRKKFVASKLRYMDGSLLDVGCGAGVYGKIYKKETYFGMDLSKAVVKRGKKDLSYANFLVCDAQDISLRPNSVDHALCTEVLEHLATPLECLSEIYNVLRPKGILLVTTPNFLTKNRPKVAWFSVLEMYGIKRRSYLHTAFKPVELKEMVERLGFRTLDYGTLEKETLYSAIIATLVNVLFRSLLKKSITLPKSWLSEKICISTYKVLEFFHLHTILNSVIKEGTRSYVVAQKPCV